MSDENKPADKEGRRQELMQKLCDAMHDKEYGLAIMNTIRLVTDYEDRPGLAQEIVSLVNDLTLSDGNQALAILSETIIAAAKASLVKEEMAKEILTLSCKEGLDCPMSAKLTLLALENLPAESLAIYAAAERLIRITDSDIAEDELPVHERLKYSQNVFNKLKNVDPANADAIAIRRNAMAAWLEYLEPLEGKNRTMVMQNEDRQRSYVISHLKTILPLLSEDKPLASVATSYWRRNIISFFQKEKIDHIDMALSHITTVAANPATKGLIETENNKLWDEAFDEIFLRSEIEDQKKWPYTRCKASGDKIYATSPNPDDCAAIKALIATRLLDIAQNNRSLPFAVYQSTMEAARYDGADPEVKKRLVEVLTWMADNDNLFNVNQQKDAKEKLASLIKDPPGGQSPDLPKPPPAPNGP